MAFVVHCDVADSEVCYIYFIQLGIGVRVEKAIPHPRRVLREQD